MILTTVGHVVIVGRGLNSLERATDVELLGNVVEVVDSRMGKVIGAIDKRSLLGLVGTVDVLDGQDGKRLVVAGVQKDDALLGSDLGGIDLSLVDIQGDGNGPERARGKAHVLDNATYQVSLPSTIGVSLCLPIVVLLVQETLERRETTVEDELEITQLTVGKDKRRERLNLSKQSLLLAGVTNVQVLEDATVGSVGHCLLLKRERRFKEV